MSPREIKELEGWIDDANRIRVVYTDGGVSRWFSRLLHTGDDGVLVIPGDIERELG